MIIYSKKDNNKNYKEFLIPKGGDVKKGDLLLHFTIDNVNVKFTVKKILVENILDKSIWEVFNDRTFPSSLLNHFIMTSHELKQEDNTSSNEPL